MKGKATTPIFIIILFLTTKAFGQQNYPDSGFTNKAEASNQMVNGLKEGKWLEFADSTGEKTTDTNAPFYILRIYRSGKKNGMERGYYRSGKEFFENPYSINGINGTAKVYLESGILLEEISYVDGRKNGISREYYENGKLKLESSYKDSLLNGVEKKYYENGRLSFEVSFADGKRNGVDKTYDEDGRLLDDFNFSTGKQNGVKKGYYDSGKLHYEAIYTNDYVDTLKYYDENGNEIKRQ